MIRISDKSQCCGCTACANACPKSCINMEPDFEGFLYPVVDSGACVNCGLCEEVCPILSGVTISDDIHKSFVVQNKDMSVLNKSTSGGFFQALFHYTIEHNGYVVGAVFNEKFRVDHKITDSIIDAEGFMGSKYVQSNLANVFHKIKKLLETGNLVTFSGTPCQVAGLKSYLRDDFQNLLTVDFVCRSIPSPKLWEKYLEYQQNKYRSEIESIQCRSKTYGYHHGSQVIRFKNGKKYSGSNRVDLYNKAFHHDVCSRPSCYACRFKTISRCSDFTIFDCWYPEKLVDGLNDNNQGYTNVLIHSKKGIDLYEGVLQAYFSSYAINVNLALSHTGGMAEKAIDKPIYREEFYEVLEQESFEIAISRFVKVSFIDWVVECIKPVLYQLGLLK